MGGWGDVPGWVASMEARVTSRGTCCSAACTSLGIPLLSLGPQHPRVSCKPRVLRQFTPHTVTLLSRITTAIPVSPFSGASYPTQLTFTTKPISPHPDASTIALCLRKASGARAACMASACGRAPTAGGATRAAGMPTLRMAWGAWPSHMGTCTKGACRVGPWEQGRGITRWLLMGGRDLTSPNRTMKAQGWPGARGDGGTK